MREFALSAAFLALGVTACGAITGLGAYSEGPAGDASVNVGPQSGSSGGQRDDGASSDGTEMTGNDDASDAVASDEAGDDAPTSDDGGESDATGATPDSSAPQEAGAGGQDAAPEAAPVCSTSNCGGCCSDGQCVGGMSTATCGKGGVACHSCSGSTPVCSTSTSTCVAEPMEASAPTCNVSSCPLDCIPVYQRACCKSDNTCGCQVDIPSIGTCM